MSRYKSPETRQSRRDRKNSEKFPELIAGQSELDANLEREMNKLRFGPLKGRNAKQIQMMQTIEEKRISFVTGPAGTGKAQPLDAAIKVPGGWSTMGSLGVGSVITGADGLPTTVTAVYPQGTKDIFKITFQDGRSTECCDDHLWEVYRYEWSPKETRNRVIPLSEIRKLLITPSAKKRLYIPLIDPEDSPNIELPIDPYLLGSLLGDGHIGRSALSFSSADSESINMLRTMLPEDVEFTNLEGNPYDYKIVKKNRRAGGVKNSLRQTLRELGLEGCLSVDKFIPNEYMSASISQRFSILQGLFDTDGTVDKTGSISYCTVSPTLAKQVTALIRGLGGIAKVSTKISSYTYLGIKKEGQLAYNIRVRIKNPRNLFRLTRKLDKLGDSYQYSDCLRLRIKSVEYVGEKEAQCISVDNSSKLYVTNDFIATHNTFVATSIACEMLEAGLIERITIVRPMVGCEEEMGFIPGDEYLKYAQWLGPFLDILEGKLGKSKVESYLKFGKIVASPLMTMRGSTFRNAMVILDEAQNTTPGQMKMFLTRLGEGSRVVVDGDVDQSDLPHGKKNGLSDALEKLANSNSAGFIEFTEDDITRDPLVREIVLAYRNQG